MRLPPPLGAAERRGRLGPRRGAAARELRRRAREGARAAAGRGGVVPAARPYGRRGDPLARRAGGSRAARGARSSSAEALPRSTTVSSCSRRSRRHRPASRAAPASRRGVRWPSDNAREMSRIYALANQKGGVGKTTTAVNLAACLAEAGERALVIDLDPQANATSGLGMRANGTSSYDLLDGAPLAELVQHTAFANLDLVPAKPDLAGAVVELARRDDGERYLAAGARVGQRPVRLRLPRLPAVARAAHGERARRVRPRARPGAGGVLRARGSDAAACSRSS